MPKNKQRKKKTVITDELKKKAYEIYANTNNKRETARQLNISEYSVRLILKDENLESKEAREIIARKKKDNTLQVMKGMDSRLKKLFTSLDGGIDRIILLMNDDTETLRDIAGATKIISEILFKMKDIEIREADIYIKKTLAEIKAKELGLKEREVIVKEKLAEQQLKSANGTMELINIVQPDNIDFLE